MSDKSDEIGDPTTLDRDDPKHYTNAIHYMPIGSNNYACFNGSAHLKYSRNIDHVTCPQCLKVRSISRRIEYQAVDQFDHVRVLTLEGKVTRVSALCQDRVVAKKLENLKGRTWEQFKETVKNLYPTWVIPTNHMKFFR